MKHIKKFKQKEKKQKNDQVDSGFSANSLLIDDEPSITTQVEDQKETTKELEKMKKVKKFESFITINIDNVENIEIENEYGQDDEDFDAEYQEDEGCGCCDDCVGEPGCDCGCEDCMCKDLVDDIMRASSFVSGKISEGLKFHLDNNKPITENIFRPGSQAFYDLINEARLLFDKGNLNLCSVDKLIFEKTEIGNWGYFNGVKVPLDLPMENVLEVNEAKHHGKEVKLNYPMRSSGPKKYKVYVKNPKTGKIKCVNFGDVKGGLTSKVNDPKARKAFADRHKCSQKKDKTKAGYWACRLPRYKHLVKTDFTGYW